MKHVLCLLLTGLLATTLVHARTLPDPDAAKKLADQFMAQLLKGESESGYTQLSAYTNIDFEQFNARGKKMLSDLQQIEGNVGKPVAFDHIATQSVKSHLMKLTYLLKYPRAAVIWELNFYQPDLGWSLVDVTYHTNINELFRLGNSAP